MPRLARWFIKTSLLWFGLALSTALAMALWPLLGLHPSAAALWQPYLHMITVGWLTGLIIGVAFWLFPRAQGDDPRGRTWLAWLAFWTLNPGLAVRVVAEPSLTWSHAEIWRWLLVVAAILQWVGLVSFALYIWSRVRAK